jgi:catechol 2,3-dioxygenase
MAPIVSTSPHAGSVTLHPSTAIGAISLTVTDLARSREFYERAIGLTASGLAGGGVGMGAAGGPALVELDGDPSAPALDRRATGLFHLALLLPTRRDLALALARIAEAGWPLDGASDHLVSEALYLSDPDGNGIEIYRDRPRAEWPDDDGALRMATLRLDLHDVLGELAGADDRQAAAPAATTIGHVHLQVSELHEIERFYGEIIGLDVVVRGYPGALFMSAGGYHHHLGLNTWNSRGGPCPAVGAVGLRHYELALAGEDRDRIVARARAAGIEVGDAGGAPLLRDPSGNPVRLVHRR